MIQNKFRELSNINRNVSYEGEPLENKIRRILDNKEPITDSAPIIYTERKDGVMPAYNIRTDRFEIAIEAMDKVAKSKLSKREQVRGKDNLSDNDKKSPDSLQGTDLGETKSNNN